LIQFAVLAYFLLVAIAVVMLVFPDYRMRIRSSLWLAVSNACLPVFRFGLRFSSNFAAMLMASKCRFYSIGRYVAANPALSAAAVMVILAPSLFVLAMGGAAVFDFADDATLPDRQIVRLLEGEQLVPPPPLPPEVFTTREVEMVRPDISHASRNWNQLDQEFTQRLLIVFKLMKERHGYEMVLIEGYRSPERQAQLQAQGSHVTQVGANMSYHQHGLAADSAFYRDGRIVISERDPWAMRGYELYGQIAEQLGLTWGGAWKMQDYGHVELRRKGVLGRPAR